MINTFGLGSGGNGGRGIITDILLYFSVKNKVKGKQCLLELSGTWQVLSLGQVALHQSLASWAAFCTLLARSRTGRGAEGSRGRGSGASWDKGSVGPPQAWLCSQTDRRTEDGPTSLMTLPPRWTVLLLTMSTMATPRLQRMPKEMQKPRPLMMAMM